MTIKMVDNKALKILLIEDDLADAIWIEELLNKYSRQKSNLKHATRVEEAIESLDRESFDAILLGLSLEERSIASLDTLKQKAPQSPIVVLTAAEDPDLATQSIRQGAQDYLIKEELEERNLIRAIQYAIERQRAEFEIRLQALMKKMLDRIRNSIDLKEILQTTTAEIQQFLQSDRAFIYCCESERETTVVSQSADNKPDRLAVERFIDAVNFSSLCSILSESTSVRAIADTWAISPQEFKVAQLQPVRSYLILPIWLEASVDRYCEDLLPIIQDPMSQNREGLWGMLVAYNVSTTRSWRDWEISFLQRLTTQVTVAIAQSQLCCQLQTANQKLQQLAILDGLTGIANRRYFDLVLKKEWQRFAREQQPLSLILCDIDYFKAYNDTYGHQQGDRCLQKVARVLQQSIRRPADLAARYGGEEFAIILPNTDDRGALQVAQKIVRQLADRQLPHQKSKVSNFVTLSIGVATKIPQPKQSFDNIIDTADRLLYQAKQSGRNQLAADNYQINLC